MTELYHITGRTFVTYIYDTSSGFKILVKLGLPVEISFLQFDFFCFLFMIK